MSQKKVYNLSDSEEDPEQTASEAEPEDDLVKAIKLSKQVFEPMPAIKLSKQVFEPLPFNEDQPPPPPPPPPQSKPATEEKKTALNRHNAFDLPSSTDEPPQLPQIGSYYLKTVKALGERFAKEKENEKKSKKRKKELGVELPLMDIPDFKDCANVKAPKRQRKPSNPKKKTVTFEPAKAPAAPAQVSLPAIVIEKSALQVPKEKPDDISLCKKVMETLALYDKSAVVRGDHAQISLLDHLTLKSAIAQLQLDLFKKLN